MTKIRNFFIILGCVVLLIWIKLAFAVEWIPYTSIEITSMSPKYNDAYLAGAKVAFSYEATDWDAWGDEEPYLCEQDDVMNYDKETDHGGMWSATGGSFPNGIYGTSVNWTAPNVVGSYTISLTVKDLAQIYEGDTGTRDDTDAETQIGIYTVIPWCEVLNFSGSDNQKIYDVSSETEFVKDITNEPAVYKKDGDIVLIGVKFKASSTLAAGASVLVSACDPETSIVCEASDSWSTTWPSSGITMEGSGDNELPDEIKKYDNNFTLNWRYKIPTGSNEWIYMSPTSTNYTAYLIFDDHVCSDTDFTKAHIDDAVGWAAGLGSDPSESAVASEVNDNVSGAIYPTTNCVCDVSFEHVWAGAKGTLPAGQCCCRAKGVIYALEVLGMASNCLVYVNERSEPGQKTSNPDSPRYCSTCGAYCLRAYWDGIWNHWEAAARIGVAGSQCYAPAEGYIGIDEGTYSEIKSAIDTNLGGFKWFYGTSSSSICTHLSYP